MLALEGNNQLILSPEILVLVKVESYMVIN